jgi:hypothetical protein
MSAKTSTDENVSRETLVDSQTCSKCEKPLDTTGFPKWCKACQNAYRQEYRRTRLDMSETRGFAAGVASTKAFIASEFEKAIRGAQINGYEAARLVRACRGPEIPIGN